MGPMDGVHTDTISEQGNAHISAGSQTGYSKLENLRTFWYVACLSDDLQLGPLARTIVDQSIVLFRDPAGRAHALFDRCCHRGLPLSLGTVTQGGLQCGYHGWEFAPGGKCIR